jgi:DNA-binding transcriptional LysR family regulator
MVMFDRHGAFTTFVRIVEAGSISGASRDLGLSQSAVSQALKALETRLAVRLIDRDTRGMALTDAGRAFYAKAKVALEAMADAESVATESTGRLAGRLKVQAPVAFGENYLGPMVIEFQEAHAGLEIELVLDDHFVDVATQNIDVAIRFGGITSNNLVIRRLGLVDRALVASPAYLARVGSPNSPDELIGYPYLKFSLITTGDFVPLVRGRERVEARIRPTFQANNAKVLLDALVRGLGIGAAQVMNIHNQLTAGTLVTILRDWLYEPLPIHAVYPSSRFIPARVRAFVTFVEQRISSVPGLR